MSILFASTVFVAAGLLFLVQPMVARMVLPLLGGVPAVWNTALVFYQATLLAGYAGAHVAARHLDVRAQALWYPVVLAAAGVVLPIGIPPGWTPPGGGSPIPWLLTLLVVAVGAPFLVLSAASPLLQHWLAATAHGRAADPYFLYGASNLGSLAALLAYPLVLEPAAALDAQSRLWTAAYAALALLALGCAVTVWRTAPRAPTPRAAPREARPDAPLSPARRARWLFLGAVPASLMLSVTTHLSTDIAAEPLLWVVPLAIYLFSLALAFAPWPLLPRGLVVRIVPLAVLPLVLVLAARAHEPVALLAPTHLGALFVVALACHTELARDRPPPGRLTEFYLWLSAGGVSGGILNALVAPLAFTTVAEYPLTLVLACLLMAEPSPTAGRPRLRPLDVALPGSLALLAWGLFAVIDPGPDGAGLVIGALTLVCAGFAWRPVRFGLGAGAILFASALHGDAAGRVLHAERSFFGHHRVTLDREGQYHVLLHGTTLHGLQSLDPARQREPLAYFHPTGPIGQLLGLLREAGEARPVAVVGLGAGTLACHGRPGQRWTFYEIDPAVERIARDPRYFTFLRDCPAAVEVVLGDARLSLARAPAGRYGLLILDAYSSDAPPLHLLTREALRLYLDRLAPGGILVFNVTNRHLDLAPVLGRLADDAGLVALVRHEPTVSPAERRQGKLPSGWLAMARDPGSLAPLAADSRWVPATPQPGTPTWTDGYSALVHVFHWR